MKFTKKWNSTHFIYTLSDAVLENINLIKDLEVTVDSP